MNSRIVKLRKNAGWTQDEFAEKIGISKNYVSLIENGKKTPGDRLISDICREFNVNEDWLRSGEGNMYKELPPPEDEVAAAVSSVLEDINCDNSIYTLIKEFLLKYERLDPKSKKVLDDFADSAVDEYIKKREDH